MARTASGTRNTALSGTPTSTDTFLGYTSNYKVLHACDVTTGWSIFSDTTSLAQNTTSFKEGTASLQLNFTQTATNRSAAFRTITSTDISAMAKMGFFARVASNVKASRFEIRIGTDSSNYNEYRYTGAIESGWTFCEFDLASPFSTTGSPNLAAITYMFIAYYYNASETNTSWSIDGIYAYKSPNFTNGVWTYPNSSTLYGVVYPSTDGMLVNQYNRYNSGNHGRAMYGSTTPTNFDLSIGLVKVNDDAGKGWAKVMWDFADGINYTGVYISAEFSKVGIEQYVAGTRNYSDVAFTFTTGVRYTILARCNGNDITLFINGVPRIKYTITSPRTTGAVCLEAYSGNVDSYPTASTTIKFNDFQLFSTDGRPASSTRSAAGTRQVA